jgi:hypothetical protein
MRSCSSVTEETQMHPTLMTMIAEDRSHELRSAAATHRRGRLSRTRARRRFLPHLPRRATQVAHV